MSAIPMINPDPSCKSFDHLTCSLWKGYTPLFGLSICFISNYPTGPETVRN